MLIIKENRSPYFSPWSKTVDHVMQTYLLIITFVIPMRKGEVSGAADVTPHIASNVPLILLNILDYRALYFNLTVMNQ